MRRYAIIIGCSCRVRHEYHALPATADTIELRCEFCREVDTVDLHGVPNVPTRRRREGDRFWQATHCAHPTCGERFDFTYGEQQGDRLYAKCPHCRTLNELCRRGEGPPVFATLKK